MRRTGTILETRSGRSLLLPGIVVAGLLPLLLVAKLSGSAGAANQKQDASMTASVHLLYASANSLSFSLKLPPISAPATGDLSVSGLNESTATPGLPALPFFSTYIVLPPESQPQLTIRAGKTVVMTGVQLPEVPRELVDTPPLAVDPVASGVSEQEAAVTGEPALAKTFPSGLYPAKTVEVSEPMMVRDVRLARVTVFPIKYDANKQQLDIAPEIEVVIEFRPGAQVSPRRLAPSYGDQHLATIAKAVINPEQIEAFRALPASLDGEGTALPIGAQLFEVGVISDGIHRLTYGALKQAGLAVDEIDPASLQMMYRGQPVATTFSGDSDTAFEPGEALLFYGQTFAGSRLERQFISQNTYWLWAGGEVQPMDVVASVAGQPVTSTLDSFTNEPEAIYFPGYTNLWPENEPDAWYWDWWTIHQAPLTRTYSVTLASPALKGPAAQFTAEFSSRDSHISDQTHFVTVTMNSQPSEAGRSWWGEQNFNVSASVPLSSVLDGVNSFSIQAWTEGTSAYLALNRITVDYQRSLQAAGDRLVFSDQVAGSRQYQVRGYSRSAQKDYLAWDISNPLSPTVVLSSSIQISGSGPYTVTFGRQTAGDARFILTTSDNILAPASITPYVAPALDPPGGAEWVAIAHREFLTETRRLANHRAQASFGGLITHVVDIDDVIDEYGYGLPVPAAIQDYLAHAMADWPTKPSYVVLVGDTTLDPRHIRADWTDEQYVPTDLVFVDPYNGQIPSDLTFALISGDDILPDLAVGRIAVETVAELELVVDKIIHYDNNQRLSFGWMQNMLFVADKFDPAAGDFCGQSKALAGRLPTTFQGHVLCLDDYSPGGVPDAKALRDDMTAFLENTGATMLTYRGHGAIDYWGGNPVIYSLALAAELKNQQPFVAISGDCLDGHYAYPPWEGLGERLVNFWAPADGSYGAAAHWGSSGLGISIDHTDMLNGFYDGLFLAGATAIGDAVTYAKLVYYLDPGNAPSLLYSFNLQGDPAMQVMRPDIELAAAWQQPDAWPGESVSLTLTVQNHGLYPSQVTLIGDPIPGFTISAVSSTVSYSVSIVGDSPRIALQFGSEGAMGGIPRNGQAAVTVKYAIAPDAPAGPSVARYETQATGMDAWPGDEQIAEKITVLRESLWLPSLSR